MSIIRLTTDNFERFELVANPKKTFTSSSSGVTGSVALFADASSIVKDVEPSYQKASGSIDDNQIELVREQIATLTDSSNIEPELANYLDLVNKTTSSYKITKRQEVLRFTPGVTFEKNFLRILIADSCVRKFKPGAPTPHRSLLRI